jgi:hypothetical protein
MHGQYIFFNPLKIQSIMQANAVVSKAAVNTTRITNIFKRQQVNIEET